MTWEKSLKLLDCYVFRFTFMTPPVTTPQQCEVHVTHSGLCHGLVMWWELSLCPNVSLSTSPWKRTQVSQP